MRLLIFNVCLLIPAVGFAAEWTPPRNPDPQAIMMEAKADTAAGRYEDALAKQLWYHANATKIRPSQSGVRLSFALNNWLELGEVYPPALLMMKQVRDETEKRIRDENQVRVRFEDFHDFVALNRTLRQEERTTEVFTWLDETDEVDAQRLFDAAEPALIKQKSYELCGKYIDPDRDLARFGERYQQGLQMGERFGKPYRDYVDKKFLNETTTLVAILVQNNRKPEAEEAAEKAKSFVKDADLLKKLSQQLESALDGIVPKPWP